MFPEKHPAIHSFLWIAGTAFLAVLPMLLLGNSWGHDFDFHTSMWMDAEQQLRQGILYPRWAALANSGFGEPSLIFYPHLSWMAGGLLGLILPWKFAACAYVWLVLALAGSAMWKCAREWLSPPYALMASLVYAVNPYFLVMVYKRCSYGELLAGAFFPLLVWTAIRIAHDGAKMVPSLALAFAAIWLADLPAGMIASYSLALLLVAGSIVHRSPRPLLCGSAAIVAAFCGLAFFLLPAAWERQWVEIGLVFRPEWIPDNNFLFTQNSDPIMSRMNQGLSSLAVLLLIVAAVATLLSRRFRQRSPDGWYLLVALAAASAFLMFRASWILWRILPALSYVEYPWRWLSPLCLSGAVLVSAATAESRRRHLLWLAAALATASIGGVILKSVRWDYRNGHIEALASAARSGTGYRFSEAKDWRLPLGSHPSKLPDFAPLVASPDGAQIHISQWSPERKVFSVESPRPTLLKIKLLNYPAWQAKVDGKVVPLNTSPETGQMLLWVPPGSSHAEIAFTRTADRTAGFAISFATFLLVAAFAWRTRNASAQTIHSFPRRPPA